MNNLQTQTNGQWLVAAASGDIATQLLRERSQRLQAEQEIGILRQRLAGRERRSRIALQAIRDGSELLLRKTTGYATGQRTMQTEGMSRRRWTWAVAFLRRAQLVNLRPSITGLRWRSGSPEQLFAMLDQAANTIRESPRGLDELRNHLPVSYRR